MFLLTIWAPVLGCIAVIVTLIIYAVLGGASTDTIPKGREQQHLDDIEWMEATAFGLLISHKREMSRMSASEFYQYCLSRGLDSMVYSFFQLRHLETGDKEVNPRFQRVYRILREDCQCLDSQDMVEELIKNAYFYNSMNNPDAAEELIAFSRFRRTDDYKPQYQFDVRYPSEQYQNKDQYVPRT